MWLGADICGGGAAGAGLHVNADRLTDGTSSEFRTVKNTLQNAGEGSQEEWIIKRNAGEEGHEEWNIKGKLKGVGQEARSIRGNPYEEIREEKNEKFY